MRSTREPGRAGALIGRAHELAVLRSALRDAADGMGRLVLVVGEPGIGKTRLAQEIAGRALAAGHAVAWGRCVEADGAPPYWPWLRVLRTLGLPTDTLLSSIESPEERFSRYEDVTSAIAETGTERPTVVVIDDARWADEPSLLLLRHVADRVADLPLVVVMTARDVEPQTTLRSHLAGLVRVAGAAGPAWPHRGGRSHPALAGRWLPRCCSRTTWSGRTRWPSSGSPDSPAGGTTRLWGSS